jgi:hypothetical protein
MERCPESKLDLVKCDAPDDLDGDPIPNNRPTTDGMSRKYLEGVATGFVSPAVAGQLAATAARQMISFEVQMINARQSRLFLMLAIV